MAKKLCFVIMPFAKKFTGYYQTIYVPAIRASGLRGKKADTDAGPETLLDGICRDIVASDVVLAELTGRKLNVSYEVGYAHAAGKPVILIAQSMRAVPSDIKHIRVVRYREGEWRWRKNLKEAITAAIKAVVANPDRFRPRAFAASSKGRDSHAGTGTTGRQKVSRSNKVRNQSDLSSAVGAQMRVAAAQHERLTDSERPSATQGFLHVSRAVPSQIKQLAAFLKDYFGVQLQWKGEGEKYVLSWSAPGAPDVSKVSEFAEGLGMTVIIEGQSA
jgi:hypothetical protein